MKKILNLPLKIANNYFKKLIGLTFKNNINYCLLFKNCNSIHTFFMFECIDVIMTDKYNKILYIKKNIKPNRIILPKKNCINTYEFPKDTIIKFNLKINDTISFNA